MQRVGRGHQFRVGLLRELVRTSRDLVFVAMPNNIQVGYWLRKLLIDRDFFTTHDETWTHIGRIRHILEEAGVEILQGLHDGDILFGDLPNGAALEAALPKTGGGEDGKVAMRRARQEANDQLKKEQKDGDITEDEFHGDKEAVQQERLLKAA